MIEPRLTDGVVTLSPLVQSDLDAHLAGEDEELVRWLSGGRSTREGTEAYIRHCLEQWATGGPLRQFGVRVDGALVGAADLRFEGEGLGDGEVNVAYGLYPGWRGKGFATRAVLLIIRYAAEQGASRAVIKVEPANHASVAVAGRAGFGQPRRIRETSGTEYDRYVCDLPV